MPIYDYRCDECGHAFSAVQSYTEGPIEKCPSCGKRPRRLITSSAIVFKGSGWYKTDSRPKPPTEGGETTKTDTKSETKTETKSETNTDAKAGAKTESKPAADAKPPTKSEAKS